MRQTPGSEPTRSTSLVMPGYDVITVGGGLAGSALSKSLVEGGMKVLTLERETVFKDRVRGEQIHPWGVAELRQPARPTQRSTITTMVSSMT